MDKMKKILVVDDEPDVCFVLEELLSVNGFALYREIKRFNKKVKVCFITAGEIYYNEYSDIFSSIPAKYFIRKPIENEELMKRINEIIADDTELRRLLLECHCY